MNLRIYTREDYAVRESDERPWGRYEVLEERPGFKVKVLKLGPARDSVYSAMRVAANIGSWSKALRTWCVEKMNCNCVAVSTFTFRHKLIIASVTAPTHRWLSSKSNLAITSERTTLSASMTTMSESLNIDCWSLRRAGMADASAKLSCSMWPSSNLKFRRI